MPKVAARLPASVMFRPKSDEKYGASALSRASCGPDAVSAGMSRTGVRGKHESGRPGRARVYVGHVCNASALSRASCSLLQSQRACQHLWNAINSEHYSTSVQSECRLAKATAATLECRPAKATAAILVCRIAKATAATLECRLAKATAATLGMRCT